MTSKQTAALVGVARVTQRVEEPGGGLDAVDLMSEAVSQALSDAGVPGLASRIGLIGVPRGTWRCTDPARVIAERIGASGPRTISAEIGVLQQSLIAHVCDAIANGDVDAAIVCGGEARYRYVNAARAGVQASEHAGPEAPPEDVWSPKSPVVSAFEFERGIVMATVQYAMFESAFAHAHGLTGEQHHARLGALWSRYASAASRDELAWDRSAPDAATIATPSPNNRMVSYPYTRLLCSQMNVDQAAALVFASTSVLRELGAGSDRAIFPRSSVESNAMIPTVVRRDIHRWPAFRLAATRALDLAGLSLDDVELMEIYSCFPSAVQVQCAEVGIPIPPGDAPGSPGERPLTVTGGMTFGGGPLNNFVLQATAAMAEALRAGEGSSGLVTSISGLLTKPAAAVWSASPGSFASGDVAEEALLRTPTVPQATDEQGPATIVGATVDHPRGRPPVALAIVELEDGSRTVVSSDGADEIEVVTDTDPVGRHVTVVAPGRFSA